MKKTLIALLLLLSFSVSLVSCTEYIPPVNPETPPVDPGGGDGPGDGPKDPSEGEDPFTATIMLDGKPYSPDTSLDMKVRWTDGQNTYTANVDSAGKAQASGLDGDYSVTLLGLPTGYTYNPNIYKATNDKRDVKIELVKLTPTIGSGEELYKCINLSRTGSYRAEIKKAGGVVYYEFTPTKAGIYKVESMMDISANMYNPVLKVYTGTFAAKFEQAEIDGGGVSNSYTKNFLYNLNIPQEYVHNTYTFAIRVEGKDATYPTNVDFTLSYVGTAEDVKHSNAQMMIPEFIPSELNYFDMLMYGTLDSSHLTAEDLNNPTYKWINEYRAYLDENMNQFGFTWVDAAERVDGKKVFNSNGFKLNEDDGYYHLYDAVKYAATGGWGPILYADITVPCLFMENPINTMEYAGNKALTVSEGTENYKLFIEGNYELTLSHGDSGPYFCNNTCSCYKTYNTARLAFFTALQNYAAAVADAQPDIQSYINALKTARDNLMHTNGGACDSTCTSCNNTCYHLPDGNKFQVGYANISVGGRVPVTEELKDFLQKLSEAERYFSDGNGWVETQGYTAFEDSQWLFACGYYQ